MIKKIIKLIGLILIISSCVIPFYYFSKEEVKSIAYQEEIEEKLVKEKYYAVLEIPKIKLKRELFPVGDINNDVNKNIFIQENSVLPNDVKSNVIIAGHSGAGSNAYFQNLYKTSIGDIINLFYNDYLYTYEIKEIEYQDKTGTLFIKEEYPEMITLITCTKNNSKTQTIYYATLKNKEKIVKN